MILVISMATNRDLRGAYARSKEAVVRTRSTKMVSRIASLIISASLPASDGISYFDSLDPCLYEA